MENNDQETVDDITLKTWRSVENSLTKEGYREGITAGKESVLQASFDSGYKEGFKLAYAKGFLQGFLSVLESSEDPDVPKCPNEKDKLSGIECSLCNAGGDIKDTNSVEELHHRVSESADSTIEALKTEYGEILRTMNFEPDVICCKEKNSTTKN